MCSFPYLDPGVHTTKPNQTPTKANTHAHTEQTKAKQSKDAPFPISISCHKIPYLDPGVEDHGDAQHPEEGQGRLRAAEAQDGEEGRDEEELKVDAEVPAVV